MSKWTGKSDFADWCEMHNNPEDIVKYGEVYLGNAKCEIKDEKDLVPYYTNLIAMMVCNKEPKHQVIHLSQNSFIDNEEADFLVWKIIESIKVARKAKKEKVPFTYEYLKNKIYEADVEEVVYKQIIEQINHTPEVIKYHISNKYNDAHRFVVGWLIPEYFGHIHLPRFNLQRIAFLEFCRENGFKVYTSKKEFEEMAKTDIPMIQRAHTLLWSMANKVYQFDSAVEKYGKK